VGPGWVTHESGDVGLWLTKHATATARSQRAAPLPSGPTHTHTHPAPSRPGAATGVQTHNWGRGGGWGSDPPLISAGGGGVADSPLSKNVPTPHHLPHQSRWCLSSLLPRVPGPTITTSTGKREIIPNQSPPPGPRWSPSAPSKRNLTHRFGIVHRAPRTLHSVAPHSCCSASGKSSRTPGGGSSPAVPTWDAARNPFGGSIPRSLTGGEGCATTRF